MTQREMYNMIIGFANGTIEVSNEDKTNIVEFCNGRIAQIDKKNANATSKPKKATEEQIAMREAIVEYLKTVERASVAEIMLAINASSNQKVTGNVNQLRKQGIIAEPVKEKKINYYSLV